MFLTLFGVLLTLWLLGLVSGYAIGGFIHFLLLLAVLALIFEFATGGGTALEFIRRRWDEQGQR
jgi:hypothetical protein